MVAKILAGSLQSDCECLLVERVHQFTKSLLWNVKEVVEGEHKISNADRQLRLGGLDILEDFSCGDRIEPVHQFTKSLLWNVKEVVEGEHKISNADRQLP